MSDNNYFSPGDIYATSTTAALRDGSSMTDERHLVVWEYDAEAGTLLCGWAVWSRKNERWTTGGAPMLLRVEPGFHWRDGSLSGQVAGRVGEYVAQDEATNGITVMVDAAKRYLEMHQVRERADLVQAGKARMAARAEASEATLELKTLAREAIAAGVEKLVVARDAGVSRPTLDAWLAES